MIYAVLRKGRFEMRFIKQPKSLRNRLVLYFTLVILFIAISINIFYYYSSRRSLEQNMILNAKSTNLYIIDNINKQLKSVEQLSDWLFLNKNLDKLIYGNSLTASNFINLFDAQDFINYQVLNSPVGKYISSLIYMRNSQIDIRTGEDAQQIDKFSIQETEWFKSGIEARGRVRWGSVIENPAVQKNEKYILPLVRQIKNTITDEAEGWCMLGFKPSLISDVFTRFITEPEDSLMVVDSRGICIAHKDKEQIARNLSQDESVGRILGKENGYFMANTGNQKRLVVYNSFPDTDWMIIYSISYSQFDTQNRLLRDITLTAITISVIFSIVLTFFLSLNLTRPLRHIFKRLEDISSGVFKRDAALEGEDEMGILGKGINEMAGNIQKLLDRVIKEETEKRKLELKVLQNQVNPHFLYNTLNSIKWMATVQRAGGVADMISALGRLLRNIARGTDEKITLKEELTLLDDYLCIQDARYKGRIEVQYRIADERLYQYRILKFTLQPVVENAIFHGIEPKKGMGLINIEAFEEENEMVLVVTDNGVGMSGEQIKNLFLKPDDNARGLSGIGVKNVDRRIKITYGEQYGLKIESSEGAYTKVRINIPKEE